MGYLHAGHLFLLRRARRECDLTVASIFVNPLQFGPSEDFASYPRAAGRDRALLRREWTDLLFLPRQESFYPRGFATRVSVSGLDQRLCGPFRPGHFIGVATVVMKLLVACEPDRLYLGSKDYQQARLLSRMVADLNLGVRVVICPTVREPDGLALSSRNNYLSEEERRWAPALYRALTATAQEIHSGALRQPEAAAQAVEDRLEGGPGQLQYAEVLSAEDLSEVRPLRGRLVLALAYRLGSTRLIDNVLVRAPERGRTGREARRGEAKA
jgi:pantoate--beta-alanine ligase